MEDPKSLSKGPANSRSSKFAHKLSSLKAIIRRKTKDDSAVANPHPYPAQSRRNSKPYMSQPMLVLSNPTRPNIEVDDFSDQSASPVHDSSSLTISSYPTPPPRPILNHARKVSTQSTVSSFNGFPKTQPSAGTANVYPSAMLPATIKTSGASGVSIPNSSNYEGPSGLVKTPDPQAIERPSKPPPMLLPPVPTIPLPLSSSSSDDTIYPTVSNNPPSRPVLIMYSSTPALPSQSSSMTTDGPNGIGSSEKDGDSSPVLSVPEDSPSTAPEVPRRDRVNPKLTVNTMLSNYTGPSSAINTSSSQQPVLPLIQPRRTVSTAPRLSLPPANYRFSLNLLDGYSARLSPSVILRPPPLPILNLPVLPGSTCTAPGMGGASNGRSRRAGLMSMPALPRQGPSRGTTGHEELDDVEGDDEDEEDDTGDDVDDDENSIDSAPLEDEIGTPRSGSSERIPSSPSHSRASSSTSSYEPAHAEPSTPHEGYFGDLTRPADRRFSRSPYLPPVDMSRIDFSFLASSPSDKKGKGKLKELWEDPGRTPTATTRPTRNSSTAGNNTPTAVDRMDFFIREETETGTLPTIMKSDPSSPTQTPRPGGHFRFPLPASIPPSTRPILPTRPTENRLSVSTNAITQFPEMYKRASRSLIDVYALEKKEKVEQMVREEEEGAEEERKWRVKAFRMSMRTAVKDANATTAPFDQQQLSGDGDAQLRTSPRSAVPKRMSLTPRWGDEDAAGCGINDNHEVLKDASSAAVKQPKKANNRISMAPAYDTIIPLRRRLSMPTFNSTSTPPPPYPDLFHGLHTYGVKLTQIQPRDDEGQENLPPYSNSIYLKAIMPRKVEFSQPGVQSKDRKWRRVLCVLEGTSFRIYKPPGVSAIGEWWESKVGVGDMAMPVMSASSFHPSGGKQRGLVGDAANAIEGSKGEVQRETERGRTTPQIDNSILSNRGQGPTISSGSPTTPSGGISGNAPSASASGVLPATKSALNLAVHLLIPSSRGHGRTISDVGQSCNTPSVLRSTRSSLNIPMTARSTTPTPSTMTAAASTSVSSSSRSPSPMFMSSSLLTTPVTSSSSHRSRPSTDSMSSVMGGGGGSTTSREVTNNNVNYTTSLVAKGKKKVEDLSDPEPDQHDLIKAYTMQQAESGLGSDYLKRKHVIRVRLEGEQFLLQAKDVDNVIAWIEGLQAATNIAMDLDERVMPRGPLFPRRRRRRRVIAPDTTTGLTTPLV